jgi:methionyl-tRNA formyltransferase
LKKSFSAPKIEASMSACSWNASSADEIYAQYLALNHLYPLYATWQDQPIRFLDCEVAEKCSGDPGDIKFDYHNKRLIVGCHNNTSIRVKHVKIPGKSKISALDFSNGYLKKVSKELWKFGPGL